MNNYKYVCGVDEVGRGPLCGPVVSAAVILPVGFSSPLIKDSKKITNRKKREIAAAYIKEHALAWSVSMISPEEIDEINILQATFRSMKDAISSLSIKPDFLYIDGDKFPGHDNIPHECVIKGDSKIQCISAASILAKVFRDDLMSELHKEFPHYDWESNSGYGTKKHIEAIKEYGITEHHRKKFCSNFIKKE